MTNRRLSALAPSAALNAAGGRPGEGAIIAEDTVSKKFPADPCPPMTGCP